MTPDHPVDLVLAVAAEGARYPETPDMSRAVLERLGEEASVTRSPRRRHGLVRRPLAAALAVAVAVVLVGGAMFGAHDAVADWLGIGDVEVETVPLPDDLPGRLDLGVEVTLDEALAASPGDVAVPQVLGDPDTVLLDDDGQVTLVYGADDALASVDATGVAALVTFLPTTDTGSVLRKQVDTGLTEVVPVEVGGVAGLWMEGGPHALLRLDRDGTEVVDQGRLAGNTLLWTRGDTTVRLEIGVDLAAALEVARSLPATG